jgi:signal peptidase I
MNLEMQVSIASGMVTTTPATIRRYGSFKAPRPAYFKQIFYCLCIAAFAYGTFQLVTRFIIQSVQVVGVSMSPTLHDSERYVLNRWAYRTRAPQASDIVVIRDPTDNTYAVKRIVGKEGDSIYIKGGHIYLNGRLLNEPYLPTGTATYACPSAREQWVVCGADQYFVLGDNRNNSMDSRIYGPVARQNILGVVMP